MEAQAEGGDRPPPGMAAASAGIRKRRGRQGVARTAPHSSDPGLRLPQAEVRRERPRLSSWKASLTAATAMRGALLTWTS